MKTYKLKAPHTLIVKGDSITWNNQSIDWASLVAVIEARIINLHFDILLDYQMRQRGGTKMQFDIAEIAEVDFEKHLEVEKAKAEWMTTMGQPMSEVQPEQNCEQSDRKMQAILACSRPMEWRDIKDAVMLTELEIFAAMRQELHSYNQIIIGIGIGGKSRCIEATREALAKLELPYRDVEGLRRYCLQFGLASAEDKSRYQKKLNRMPLSEIKIHRQ